MRRLRIGAARGLVGMLAAVSVGVLALGGGAGGAAASPSPAHASDGVTAVLLDGNNYGCQVLGAWYNLNLHWAKRGSVPVTISTGGHLCQGRFTLADLEASGADTVILDATAYAYKSWTAGEIAALQTYLEQGHTLVGDDLDFQWRKHDDNGLAPLFGLAEQPVWQNGGYSRTPRYQLNEQDPDAAVLLRDVPNPYRSNNTYDGGQRPAEKKWLPDVLAGARYLGLTGSDGDAITVYDQGSYTAIYISTAAADYSNQADLQFLYNAVVYPNEG